MVRLDALQKVFDFKVLANDVYDLTLSNSNQYSLITSQQNLFVNIPHRCLELHIYLAQCMCVNSTNICMVIYLVNIKLFDKICDDYKCFVPYIFINYNFATVSGRIYQFLCNFFLHIVEFFKVDFGIVDSTPVLKMGTARSCVHIQ